MNNPARMTQTSAPVRQPRRRPFPGSFSIPHQPGTPPWDCFLVDMPWPFSPDLDGLRGDGRCRYYSARASLLHLEGTVIHDACHNAAHPNRWINQLMGHGSALLLGFSFPVFTRVHLQHHANVNDPK